MQLKKSLIQFMRSRMFLLLVATVAVLLIVPALFPNPLMLTILTLIAIYSIYASSWNFLANSGQGSLGHAAFLGIGGFAAAIIGSSISLGAAGAVEQVSVGALSVASLVLALLLGGLLSAGIGALIGLACARLKAWYLAMVTFGFSVIAATLSSQFNSITNGIDGYTTVTLIERGFPFYGLVIGFTVASILTMYWIMKTRIGLAFRAIHGNETEAKMIGINTAKYKLIAFVISTFFAGISGGLYAYYIRLVDNSIFSPAYSFSPLMMTVIGGLGTVAGPIIGAVFLVLIQQTLALSSVSAFMHTTLGPLFPAVGDVGGPLSLLIIGVILLLVVIFMPKGLISLYDKFRAPPKKDIVKAEDEKK